jgi:predicted amidophosphoribosyltransferase
MDILDFIFPKKCVICKKQGSYLCANCFTFMSFSQKSFCLVCGKITFNNLTHSNCLKKTTIDGYFSALSTNKTTEKLIYSFKNNPFLKDLQIVLSELFYESIIQNENFYKTKEKSDWILVPVPLSSSEFRKRGYNQSQILAKNLSKKLKIQNFNLLEKKNLSYKLKKGYDIRNLNIFIVDDVIKTGSILKSVARVLKENGAEKVFGLTLVSSNKKP